MEKVTSLIQSYPVVVFSKSYCPYCMKAKKALSHVPSDNIYVLELDSIPDGDAIQDALLQLTGQRTVPNVFIGGKSIGGGNETAALKENGRLDPMLQQAAAL